MKNFSHWDNMKFSICSFDKPFSQLHYEILVLVYALDLLLPESSDFRDISRAT